MTRNRTISLSDDRQLGFADLGSRNDPPVFFFHGTPGSRWVLGDGDPLLNSPVRLILPERPGYGLSSPHGGRSFVSWAKDVGELADHLGLDRFAVSGISGGGPHALACAYAMPERVSVALLLASPSPANFKGATRGMSIGNRLGLFLAKRFPTMMKKSIVSFARAFREDPKKFVAAISTQMSVPDKNLLLDARVVRAIITDLETAYLQGGEAHAIDAALAMTAGEWEFELADVHRPVVLWHGEKDTLVTKSMALHLHRNLPNCELNLMPGLGHLLVEDEQVVEEFVKAVHLHR